MLNIQQLRAETPSCDTKVHLNNAGASLQPMPVIQAIRDYFELEIKMGGYEAASFKAKEIHRFYTSLGKLLNCPAKNIAFATNATQAYNKALSSVPLKKGDVILTTDDDYVANQISFLWLQKHLGVKIIRAAMATKGGVSVDSVEQLIKKYQPQLVAITHVPTNTGLVQPVYQIGDLCHQYDILYLVDACQSVGQMEIDVQKMRCDFLSATFRKWMRGPRGTGFLYVSDKALEMNVEPMFPDLNGATWSDDFEYKLTDDAKRFEYWERNYSNLLGAKAATEYALNIGIDNIEARVNLLADYTRAQFRTIGDFQILDAGEKLCGIVAVHSPKRDWQKMKAELLARDFNVSVAIPANALLDFRTKK